MTNEEHDLITQFVSRVGGPGAAGGFAGSVPSGGGANLPPVDRDADALIGDLFTRFPDARYRITQVAFVQEHALANAQQQIVQLTQALQQARQGTQQGQPQQGASPWGNAGQQAPQQGGGFFNRLFGAGGQPGGAPQQQQPQYQQPQYQQPQYAPQGGGMMQPQGSGFLGGALRTAAGVAGGVVAADALMGLFSNHGGGGGGMFGGGGFGGNAGMPGGGEFLSGPGEQGFGQSGGGFVPDPFDQGGAQKDFGDQSGGQDVADNSAWSPAPDQGSTDSGWDSSSGGDSGWTDSSGDA